MKLSSFNLYFPIDSSQYLLYNTFTGAILRIDPPMEKALQSGAIELLSLDEREVLRSCGVIVEADSDERKKFEYRYNGLKYGSLNSTFVVIPTYSCNLSCSYCYQRVADVSRKSMDEEAFVRVSRFIRDQSLKNNSRNLIIKLFGGEPLLMGDACVSLLDGLAKWSEDCGIEFVGTLTTNGTLLSGKLSADILPYLSAVHITMDGSRSLHDEKRHYQDGRGTYDDVLRAIDFVKKSGKYLTIRINLYKDKLSSLHELLDDLSHLGICGYENLILDFGLIDPCCGVLDSSESYLKSKAEYLELLPEVTRILAEAEWEKKAHLTINSELGDGQRPICEHLKTTTYVIDPSCNLYLCPSATINEDYKLGEIGDNGAKWAGRYYDLHARNPLKFKNCCSCAYLPLCGGGCPVQAHIDNGDFNVPFCGATKEVTRYILKQKYGLKYTETIGDVV
ncbi:MAG: molybdenum cofactor biosynthesis protein A [Methanosaeta sp. PtaU1.Bin112]|nr:MAG: molybdenum cofactor biosynthesis protein A [Methanosaeta sp. PtaU1.Bin112]